MRNGKQIVAEERIKELEKERDYYKDKLNRYEIERRYLNFFDSKEVGHFVLDTEGRILEVNKYILNLLKYDKTVVVDRKVTDFISAEDYNLAEHALRNVNKENKLKLRLNLRVRSEKEIPIDISFKLIKLRNYIAVQGILTDATEQQKEELEIQQKLTSFTRSEQLANTGYWEHNFLSDKVFWSTNLYHVLGYKTGEVKPSEKLIDSHIHQEDFEWLDIKMREAFTKKENSTFNYRLITKQKTIVQVQVSTVLIKNKKGEVTGYYSVAQDTTLLANKEKSSNANSKSIIESQNKSELLYRELFESSSDAIFLIDNEEGKIKECNREAEQMYGFTHDELLSMCNTDISAEEDETRKVTAATPVVKENLVIIPLRYHKKRDGTVFPVEITGRFFELDGRKVHLASIRDISEKVKALTSLKENERKYRQLFENINEAFALFEIIRNENSMPENYRLIEINPQYEKLTGLKKDTILGKTVYDIFPAVEKETIEKYHKVAAEGEADEFVDYVKQWDKYFEIKAYCPDKDLLALTAVDVTAKVKAQQEVEKWMDVFNSVEWGVALINSERSIELINKAFAGMYQMEPEELLHHPINKIVAEDVFAGIKEKKQYIQESVHVRKDGASFPVLMTISVIREMDKTVKYLVLHVQDISNNIQTQQKLKTATELAERNEKQWKTLFNNAIDNVFVNEINEMQNGRFIEVNDSTCATLGYTREELLQMSPRDVSRPKNPEQFAVTLEQLHKGMSCSFETIVTCKNGTEIPFDVNAQCFIIGEKQYIVSFSRDISDRVKYEEELIEAKEKAELSEKLKSAFLANMSHEIRTPMNGIIGFSQMFMTDSISKEKRSYYAKIVIDSGQQLLSIVNDILDISRIESGEISISEEETSLNDLLMELFAFFRPRTKDKQLNLFPYKGLIDDASIIFTDKEKLRQVFDNLLSNAFKFTGRGQIKFGYELKREELQFFVSDTGIGIDKQMHQDIFDRFRQVELDFTNQIGGTGLGLSISQKIIELMGGQIWVESELDVGSTFYFTIPYKPKFPDLVDAGNILNDSSVNTDVVLVVEDEEINYLFIEEILAKCNVKIIHSKNGEEAVKACAENDAIVMAFMDIKMPVKDGVSATKEIKVFRPDLPIIAQTAYAMRDDEKKVLDAGFDGYLSKPIQKELLLEYVAKYVADYNLQA